MPWVDPFDPSTPADGDLASEGDDRIREMKRAINERMDALTGDRFSSVADAADLKLDSAKLEPPIVGGATISLGLDADKPSPVTTDFYFATDTKTLYVKSGAAYVTVGGAGTSSNIHLGQLRTRKDVATGNIGPVTGLPDTKWINHTINIPGATPDSYVLLSARGRVKKATEAEFAESWNYFGVFDAAANPPHAVDNPAGDLHAWFAALSWSLNGASLDINTILHVNCDGVAEGATIDYEIEVLLLAVDQNVPLE